MVKFDRKILSETDLDIALARLDVWTMRDDELIRKWKFEDFAKALSFVNKVGELAEAADHHPDIKLGWGYVEVALTTHDRGGITDVDLNLAAKIDDIEILT